MKLLLAILFSTLAAQALDVAPLIQELKGEKEPQPRSAQAWHQVHEELLAYYLPKFSQEKTADRKEGAQAYQFICWRSARPGAETERLAACRAIVKQLGKDGTKPARLWLIGILQHIGKEESLEILTSLARSDDNDIRSRALRALTENPQGENAFAILLENNTMPHLSEYLSAIPDGARLVPDIAVHVKGAEPEATAAIQALGRCAGKKALAVLQTLPPSPARNLALLACAKRLVAKEEKQALQIYLDLYEKAQTETIRSAALRGLLLAEYKKTIELATAVFNENSPRLQGVVADYLRTNASKKTIFAFADFFPNLSVSGQILLLDVFTSRNDRETYPITVKALSSSAEPVCLAAAKALGRIGKADAIAQLLSLSVRGGRIGQEADRALQCIAAPNVLETLLQEAEKGSPEHQKSALIALIARREKAAIPILLKHARKEDETTSSLACKGLATLGDISILPELVSLLTETKEKTNRRDAGKAILAIARRYPKGDKRTAALCIAIPGTDDNCKIEIIKILGNLGGTEALEILQQLHANGSEEIQATVLRSLGNWPDGKPADWLLSLSEKEQEPRLQILALRACARALGQPGTFSLEPTLERFARLTQTAKRDDERKIILSALSKICHPKTLEILEPYLDNPALNAEAATAILAVATPIAREDRGLAEHYLALVVQHAPNDSIRENAETTRRKLEEFDAYLTTWLTTGPYFKNQETCPFLEMKLGPEADPSGTLNWLVAPQTGDPAKDWQLPLQSIYGGNNRLAYAVTWIRCETNLDCQFEIGSDDGIKIWLNETIAHVNDTARPVRPGDDIVKLTLPAGWNRIMLKVRQGSGGWGACLRLRDQQGNHLTGWKSLASFHNLDSLQEDFTNPAFTKSAHKAFAEIREMLKDTP